MPDTAVVELVLVEQSQSLMLRHWIRVRRLGNIAVLQCIPCNGLAIARGSALQSGSVRDHHLAA